jgi:hypothetical protein
MTITVNKSEVIVREKLNQVERGARGAFGDQLVRTNSPQEAGYLLGLNGFKNLIHNGHFYIDQRFNGAVQTIASGNYIYGPDRWGFNNYSGTAGVVTTQVSTDAPPGFAKSILWTVSSAVTISANLRCNMAQYLEGTSIAQLNWGTIYAKPITLSFWVKASVAGQYAVTIEKDDITRSYVSLYNINTPGVWEYKSVTVPGCTDATWGTDTAGRMIVFFDLGQGANICASSLGQLNSWTTSDFRGYTNAVKISQYQGATFQMTGVQLEAGTAPTPYEHRPYQVELAICQRYCYVVNGNSGDRAGPGFTGTSTIGNLFITFPVTMRAAPSLGTVTSLTWNDQSSGFSSSTYTNAGSNVNGIDIHSVISGATSGKGAVVYFATANGQIVMSADI